MLYIAATFFREFELEEMIFGTQVLVTNIQTTRNQGLRPLLLNCDQENLPVINLHNFILKLRVDVIMLHFVVLVLVAFVGLYAYCVTIFFESATFIQWFEIGLHQPCHDVRGWMKKIKNLGVNVSLNYVKVDFHNKVNRFCVLEEQNSLKIQP